ncbi:ornithine cyclodeaminase family protein [Streptomyces abikoensis]
MTDCMRMADRATATAAPGASPASSPALVRSLAGAMRDALRSGAVGRMLVPPRETVEDAAGAKFISMPAVSPDHDLYVNKVATIVASPVPGRRATVTSVVPVFSASTGRYLGTLDGDTVTNLKCAAVTALVTDRCAAPDSRVLGIIGSGVQARQQYLGVSAVRDLTEVRAWSRDPDRAAAFARDIEAAAAAAGQRTGVVVAGSAEDAARGADILSTATTSVRPLPIGPGLPAHVHINCMGAHTTESREVSAELLRGSTVIVEDLRTAIAEAGGSHAGAIELDALFAPGAEEFTRRGTIFASTGCAYLDLITCAHLAGRDDIEGFRLTGAAP